MDPFSTNLKRRTAKNIIWKLRRANSRSRRTVRRNPEWDHLPLSTLARLAQIATPAIPRFSPIYWPHLVWAQ